MRRPAGGWRWWRGARPRCDAWAAAQGLDAGRCAVYRADVADVDSIVAAGQACIAAQGLPDVVIASAGISVGMDTAERADLDVMRDVLATNNVGLAATFHPFLAAMRARGSGTLVGVASVAAIRGLPGHGAYCASKAGVVAYCESLRGECRGSGVQVVTLLPGYIATPLTARNPYSMPFLMPAAAFRRPGLPQHRGRQQLPRDSLADGRGGQAAAAAAERRCSTACLPAAAANPGAATERLKPP